MTLNSLAGRAVRPDTRPPSSRLLLLLPSSSRPRVPGSVTLHVRLRPARASLQKPHDAALLCVVFSRSFLLSSDAPSCRLLTLLPV